MTDLISRQAALDAVRKLPNAGIHWFVSAEAVFEAIYKLPSAEPERKKGRWYKPTGMMPPEYAGRHRCTECDGFAMHDWKTHREVLTDFCPHCGADMRGDTDDT